MMMKRKSCYTAVEIDISNIPMVLTVPCSFPFLPPLIPSLPSFPSVIVFPLFLHLPLPLPLLLLSLLLSLLLLLLLLLPFLVAFVGTSRWGA